MKKAALIGVVFLLVVAGAIYYSTVNLAKHRVEVCVEFKGMTSCRTASASTEEFALRTATTNACNPNEVRVVNRRRERSSHDELSVSSNIVSS